MFKGPLIFPNVGSMFFITQDHRGKWQSSGPDLPKGNVSFLSPWMETEEEAEEYARMSIRRAIASR